MIKLKYNWVGLLIGILLSTLIAIFAHSSFIADVLEMAEKEGGEAGRKVIEDILLQEATKVYWLPYFYMLIAVIIFMGLAYLINYLILRKNTKLVWRLLSLVGFSLLCSGIILGSIEPYIARDTVEYGVRQELNQIFEIIGYASINFVVYLVPLVGALALVLFTVSNFNDDEQAAGIL
jgi:hypothetical protein